MSKYTQLFLGAAVLATAWTGVSFAEKSHPAPQSAKQGKVMCPVMKAPVRDTSKGSTSFGEQ